MIWKEGRCLHGYSALLFVKFIGFEAIVAGAIEPILVRAFG